MIYIVVCQPSKRIRSTTLVPTRALVLDGRPILAIFYLSANFVKLMFPFQVCKVSPTQPQIYSRGGVDYGKCGAGGSNPPPLGDISNIYLNIIYHEKQHLLNNTYVKVNTLHLNIIYFLFFSVILCVFFFLKYYLPPPHPINP